MGSELPTGTVTFLFTDLESSTRLWEEQPEAMRAALARHDELITSAIETHSGHVIKSTGDGLHAGFGTAEDAVGAAVSAQRAVARESWGSVGTLRVRMALHTGVAELRSGDYFGPVLNRAARLVEIAHPGQVLCSQATADLVRDTLPMELGVMELGRHQLRDLARAELVFQVTHDELSESFPPLASVDAFPGNLPTQRTALIGRTPELAKLAALIASHRLVTLTGVGGVGKTRLAVQLAAAVLDRFPDGAWLVELASTRDPALVANVVATALNVAERPGQSVTETVCDAIGTRELLVLLDNCEHLIDASARLADRLLDSCPNLRIVATSREALGVDGEQGWPTPSLAFPATELAQDLGELVRVDAVALFVDRARAVRPDFNLTLDNAPAVSALCARLDGIPLALELAAARVGALGPQDILERIDQRFLLLTGGSRTALERHQTLQAAVDWSYDLLDEQERPFFEQLSVFAGGFTLDAARAVAANGEASDVEVLDLLAGLVAKSMVVAEGTRGSVRYRLLETLRQYGRDRLAGRGDAADTRARHARYYLALAEKLTPDFFGPDQLAVLDWMNVEFDNFRAAFSWMIETNDARGALQLVGPSLGGFRDTGEILRLREKALEMATDLPANERAESLAWTGYAAFNVGDHARARTLCEESLECAREAGKPSHSRALETLGLVAYWQGDTGQAIEHIDAAISQARADEDGTGRTRMSTVSALNALAFVLGQTDERERAITAGEEAVALATGVGMPTALSASLFTLALAYRSTDLERSAGLLDESLRRGVGMRWPYIHCWRLVAAGQVRGALGEQEQALAAFSEVLVVARQTGERFFVSVALQGIARALRRLDRLDEAARFLATAQRVAEEFHIPGGPADVAARERAADRLRSLLGDERFETQWQLGQKLSLDAAIRAAVDLAEPKEPSTAESSGQ